MNYQNHLGIVALSRGRTVWTSIPERSKYAPQLSKLRAFMANGLTGVDLARCWISWSILPLSRRFKMIITTYSSLSKCYSKMIISGKLNDWHGMDGESGTLKMLRTKDWLKLQAQDSSFYILVIQDHIESIGKANTIKEG